MISINFSWASTSFKRCDLSASNSLEFYFLWEKKYVYRVEKVER